METRRELSDRLSEQGVTGWALDALLRETAPARHQWRVEQTLVAARAAVPLEGERKDALATLVLLADLAGIGGRDGVGGASTHRIPIFRGLGSGRKQARDGGAWLAAARGAVATLATSLRAYWGVTDSLVVAPSAGALALAVRRGEGEWLVVPDDTGVVPPAWRETLAREGLRRAAGLDGWFSADCVPCSWAGSPDGFAASWAAVVNAAVEDQRRDVAKGALADAASTTLGREVTPDDVYAEHGDVLEALLAAWPKDHAPGAFDLYAEARRLWADHVACEREGVDGELARHVLALGGPLSSALLLGTHGNSTATVADAVRGGACREGICDWLRQRGFVAEPVEDGYSLSVRAILLATPCDDPDRGRVLDVCLAAIRGSHVSA